MKENRIDWTQETDAQMWAETIQALRAEGFSQPDHILRALWERFSAIQAASCLIVSPESATRFRRWLEIGDDAEAWS